MRRTEADREKERAWNSWCRYSNRISGAFLWGSFNMCSRNTVLIKAYKSFFVSRWSRTLNLGVVMGHFTPHAPINTASSLHTHSEHPHLKQVTYNTHISNKSFKNAHLKTKVFGLRKKKKLHHQRASVFHRDVAGHPGCAISTVTYRRKIDKLVLVSGVYLRGGTLSGTSGLNSPFFIHRCI